MKGIVEQGTKKARQYGLWANLVTRKASRCVYTPFFS